MSRSTYTPTKGYVARDSPVACTEYQRLYIVFQPNLLKESLNKLLNIGAQFEAGMGRCVINKNLWSAYLATVAKQAEGNESSDISMDDDMYAVDDYIPQDQISTGKDILLDVPQSKVSSMKALKTKARLKQRACAK